MYNISSNTVYLYLQLHNYNTSANTFITVTEHLHDYTLLFSTYTYTLCKVDIIIIIFIVIIIIIITSIIIILSPANFVRVYGQVCHKIIVTNYPNYGIYMHVPFYVILPSCGTLQIYRPYLYSLPVIFHLGSLLYWPHVVKILYLG